MLYTIPDYYHEFSCIAGECEDTCCAGWQIVADEAALKKYKKVTGSFRKRLRKSINWKEGTFKQDKNKRCAFLNDENLCDMYTALGEKSLCRTCKMYPRHVEDDFVYAKNWSCPGVKQPANYGKILCQDMGWTIDAEHMSWTNQGYFMHCLPVRRGLIVTDDVIESDHSLVIPEAANREISAEVVLKRVLESL